MVNVIHVVFPIKRLRFIQKSSDASKVDQKRHVYINNITSLIILFRKYMNYDY